MNDTKEDTPILYKDAVKSFVGDRVVSWWQTVQSAKSSLIQFISANSFVHLNVIIRNDLLRHSDEGAATKIFRVEIHQIFRSGQRRRCIDDTRVGKAKESLNVIIHSLNDLRVDEAFLKRCNSRVVSQREFFPFGILPSLSTGREI